MAARIIRGKSDPTIRAFRAALDGYEAEHPGSETELYRSNSVCVRIRVVDPRFKRMVFTDRHHEVWQYLADRVPEDAMQQLSVLLTVTPAQAKQDIYQLDFDDPAAARS